jgi:hypothetical protein
MNSVVVSIERDSRTIITVTIDTGSISKPENNVIPNTNRVSARSSIPTIDSVNSRSTTCYAPDNVVAYSMICGKSVLINGYAGTSIGVCC